MRTQYRKQYNQPKPFHKRNFYESTGRLKKKYSVYEPRDMKVTGFGGVSPFKGGAKNLNWRRFEDNGKNITIDV